MSRSLALRFRVLAGLLILGFVGADAHAQTGAQDGSCRPPLKFAAGACVAACPGGYEDRGRTCVYRNESR